MVKAMFSLEALFSLVVASTLALLLLNSKIQSQDNSLYWYQLTNDFAEVSLKSDIRQVLVLYFSSPSNNVAEKERLVRFSNEVSPSKNICFEISEKFAEKIGNCQGNYKNSYSASRDLVLNGSVTRITFTTYLY